MEGLVRLPAMKLAWVCAALVASLVGMTPAAASPRARTATPAWRHVHYADLDGDGQQDRIWFTAGYVCTPVWSIGGARSSISDSQAST
jgi:hypothetical protein